VPSHEGIKYNNTADLLVAKASLLNPGPLSDLNSRNIIRQRSNVNQSKLTLFRFHSRLHAVLYYRLKSGALFLNSLLFNWKLYEDTLPSMPRLLSNG
jgi:hypothetical protein